MDPLPAAAGSSLAARRVLAVVVVFDLGLFLFEARGQIRSLVAPRPGVPVAATMPIVKWGDCHGYYAWLRSPLIDGDFDFANDLAPVMDGVRGTAMFAPTPAGRVPNQWSVGPALAWAPAVTLAHLGVRALGDRSPWPADGDSPPYQLAAGGTSLALTLLTVALAYRIARRFAPPAAAACGTAAVMLGTPITAYGASEMTMAHGPAAAALAAAAFVWLRTFGNLGWGRWAAVGGLIGLAALMRWQLATFAVLPALEAAWLAGRTTWRGRLGLAARLVVCGAAAALAFAPQAAGWWVVYGSPVVSPLRTGRNWLAPDLFRVVISPDRGLFYWTPLALPAAVGLLAAARRSVPAAMLAVAAAAQVYAIAALLGPEVYPGWAFGFRFLSETGVLLAPGLATLFAAAPPRTARRLAAAVGLLVGWNLLLLGVFRFCVGGLDGGTPAEMLRWVGRYAATRPFDAAAVLAVAAALTVRMARAAGGGPGRPAGAGVQVSAPAGRAIGVTASPRS